MSELFESKVNRFEVLEVIDKNICQNFNLLDYKSGLFSVVSGNKACLASIDLNHFYESIESKSHLTEKSLLNNMSTTNEPFGIN